MAILSRYGCASSTAAMSGNSAIDDHTSRWCGRAVAHSRAASLRSKARPSTSSYSASTTASGTRDLLLEPLHPPQAGVEPALRQERGVGPPLHHPAAVEHHDAIGTLGGPQPVRHQ